MGTVLVVDDDKRMLRVAARILKRDWVVTVVDSPQEALSLFRAGETYDRILSDYHMPGMTGEDLYGHLRRERPEMAERMVFMSGGGPGWDEFLSRVPNKSISKPFMPEELLLLVTAS